jgi:hypothetical protein
VASPREIFNNSRPAVLASLNVFQMKCFTQGMPIWKMAILATITGSFANKLPQPIAH